MVTKDRRHLGGRSMITSWRAGMILAKILFQGHGSLRIPIIISLSRMVEQETSFLKQATGI